MSYSVMEGFFLFTKKGDGFDDTTIQSMHGQYPDPGRAQHSGGDVFGESRAVSLLWEQCRRRVILERYL